MKLLYNQTKQARNITLKSSLLYSGLHLMEFMKRKNYFQVYNKTTVQLLLLVWMFYSRTLSNAFNKISWAGPEDHTRSLVNNIKSFFKLVTRSKYIVNHHQSIQILLKKLFNINKNLLPLTLDNFSIKH